MKTTDKQKKPILLRIADKLEQTQGELDDLSVQVALGKSEAREKYEEMKKEFSVRVNELKNILAMTRTHDATPLMLRIQALEKLLLEPVRTERLESQRKKILEAVLIVEAIVEEKFKDLSSLHGFREELEKFKLRMEILRLRFVVRKFKVKEGVRTGIKKAQKKSRQLMDKTRKRISKLRGK